MEKRAEARLPADEPVRLIVLGEATESIPARLLNLSGTGMRVAVPCPLSRGTAVQIEWEDTLLLGEVCYAEPTAEGYAIGLQLEHALLHTTELARLSRKLLGIAAASEQRTTRS